ncbi:SDR family oxidoreductase [Hymenobacter cellulosilyticus]|uniref:SDR family oxidoreductase n=1 Tax=Hymenobacter cellulosilyticus TaxID=2932248 RepID=A0A8T9Q3T4_9BACT|nr:SDR family oxidoreductase [Hymenobacter cellulosilyticus]UOQ72137.1 SDR family oxidoreductase [Hymenobacter cellulosilyticus]
MSKIILITGTSTGFGKLMTTTLAAAGHTVLAAMRETTGKNAAVAQELAALPRVEVVELDVTSDDSVQQAVTQALSRHGRIDVLINNAAVTGYGLLEAYSLDQIRRMFDVNFYGVLRTYQAVLPAMRQAKQGLVINITSGASGHTLPFMIPYLASKFAVESVTEGLQDELRDYNIENVSIQPGVYPTEMNSGVKPGVNADKEAIVAEYGEAAADKFNAMGAGLYGKMVAFDMNPQAIADGVLHLVDMPDGTRPLRYPIDAIAEGTDKEFIDARAAIKAKWLTKYTV